MKYSPFLRSSGVAVCLAAALAVSTSPLRADEAVTARVYVGDLDLRTAQGQHLAQQRVLEAIDRVCLETQAVAAPKLKVRAMTRKCREQAIASVQAQLDQRGLPRLPALG